MKTVQAVIDLSEDLYISLTSIGITKERIVAESRKLLAMRYFQQKLLSAGKAAELAGLSKWGFIQYLGEQGVPFLDYDDDELHREFETAQDILETLPS